MVQAFENFTLYYAKSIAENAADDADENFKITNDNTDNTNNIKLVYCIPDDFSKRVTDTSNALAIDKTEPDTGSGRIMVELQFTQSRETSPDQNILTLLKNMFFIKSNDTTFRKGRFGLLNTDNPGLNVEPVKFGGYKFAGFKQIPNKENPALLTYIVKLAFVGDNTILGVVAT